MPPSTIDKRNKIAPGNIETNQDVLSSTKRKVTEHKTMSGGAKVW